MQPISWRGVCVVFVALIMVGSSVAIFAAAPLSAASGASAAPVAGSGTPLAATAGSSATTFAVTGPGQLSEIPGAVSPATVAKDLAPSGVWNGPLSIDENKATAVQKVLASDEASGIPATDLYPPSLYEPAAPPSETGGHIVPTYPYPDSPAPLGLGFYGLRNISGQLTGSLFNTTAVAGSYATSDPLGVQSLYFDFSGQQSYGSQLNAVLNNVTLLGQGGYQDWEQNVINYNSIGASGQLSFELNIWNFSSSAISMSRNSIIYPVTTTSSTYEASGSPITVSYPFSFTLYINTTVNYTFSNAAGSCITYGCNQIYYNYSVYNSLGQHLCPSSLTGQNICNAKVGGQYDNVIMNSQASNHHVMIQKGSAEFVANGLYYNPYVNLPDDFEWDYGIGTSSGAMNNLVYANAVLGLLYLNASTGKFQEVPSAYNYGSETGENGAGAYVGYETINGQPYGIERTGPTLLQGLWNITGGVSAGEYPVNYASVTPGNAFIAYAPGAGVTNQSMFKVAPTFGWFTPRGTLGPNTYLSPGTYTVEVLLSDYVQQSQTITVGPSGVTLSNALVKNPSVGVYTPLWAFSTSDLANLSVSGSGTAGNPFVMPSNQPGSISLVFGDIESYLFPVWYGIYLNATTAHVVFNPPPSEAITYPAWSILGKVQTYFAPEAASVPFTYQFQMYFYHAQNVTVANAAGIGGWFSNEEVGRKYNVYVNDGKNFLFDQDFFNVSSEGLEFLDGGTNNTVWGSTFYPWSDPVAYPGIETPSTGLTVSESGDHIFNNAFYTNGTASSSATYTDFWNATGGYQPATNSIQVNGFTLTGSILGQSFQGGNYWFNYGSVADPYGLPYVARASSPTGSASIGKGADYAPLSPYMTAALGTTVPGALGVGLYKVTFTESGLAVGNTWTMRLRPVRVSEPYSSTSYTTTVQNATTVTGVQMTASFYVPNGSYTWVVAAHTTPSVAPVGSGVITVNGALTTATVPFQWPVEFTETGLPANTQWVVTYNGKLSTGSGHSMNFSSPAGSPYPFSAAAVPAGWVASPAYGTESPAFNTTEVVTIAFTSASATTYTVYFTASGIPSGTPWQVWLNSTDSGSNYYQTGTTATLTVSAKADTYTYQVGVLSGYSSSVTTPSSGSLTVTNAAASVGITFSPVTYTVTFTESGLPGGTPWLVSFGNVIHWSTSTTISFSVAPGTYAWQIGYINGYMVSSQSAVSPTTVTGTTSITIGFSA